MKIFILVAGLLLSVGLIVPVPVFSQEQLTTQKGCGFCHHESQKKVGPSYKEIAKKYTEEDTAIIIKSIREGSKGKWGSMPMPPQRVSEREAEQLADWVLSFKE